MELSQVAFISHYTCQWHATSTSSTWATCAEWATAGSNQTGEDETKVVTMCVAGGVGLVAAAEGVVRMATLASRSAIHTLSNSVLT
jgi:hypothetical protein